MRDDMEIENNPGQAPPDHFFVKIQFIGGSYGGAHPAGNPEIGGRLAGGKYLLMELMHAHGTRDAERLRWNVHARDVDSCWRAQRIRCQYIR